MTFAELLNEFHIMPQFPPSVQRLEGIAQKEVAPCDLQGRQDLTEKLIITIDGDDAKDFDDAISLETLENGNFYLGVHIADVSHYVKEDTAVDRAAFARGTSVYLIDTVIPMLPFFLSNELCSLKPNEVRLTLSVFMEVDGRGRVVDYSISKSYIKSKNRMTYGKVTKILEGDEALSEKYPHLVPVLKDMEQLARTLKKARIKGGSIEFETDEAKITLDKSGVPVAVEKYPIGISNNIIEEFMLLANVTVAKHLKEKGLPCVFRVHEKPDMERLQRLSTTLGLLGIDFKLSPNPKPADFQKILNSAEEKDLGAVVSQIALRTMSRARYSENPLGHFGLSFEDYCHFTSPIRRYPDLIVHRILKESLDCNIPQKRREKLEQMAIATAVTSSTQEANAQDAELRWKDIKKAEYMTYHIGERHKATITHVTSTGFYARLENTVEGFVAARTIEDDLYMMTVDGLVLEGMRKRRKFTIGDTVEIKVVAACTETGKVDFEITGNRVLAPLRRKGKSGKKLSRNEKEMLHRFKEEHRKNRQEVRDERFKADSEKTIFENALVCELLGLLTAGAKISKHERHYFATMLMDTAAVISRSVQKQTKDEDGKNRLKNIVGFAAKNIENCIEIACDSFGISPGDDAKSLATEYVHKAVWHLFDSLISDDLNYAKRENEYDEIFNNLKKRRHKI